MTRYATTTDLTRLGLPSTALSGVAAEAQEDALDAASSLADGYLSSRFGLPLSAWGDDLRGCVSRLAAYDLMVTRGYSPEAGRDDQLRLRHEDAMRWLRDVASGIVAIQGVTDATPTDTTDNSGSRMITNTPRRWSR